MATHEEALTAKKALNKEAFNGRVLTVKWCALAPACTEVAPRLVKADAHRSATCCKCAVCGEQGSEPARALDRPPRAEGHQRGACLRHRHLTSGRSGLATTSFAAAEPRGSAQLLPWTTLQTLTRLPVWPRLAVASALAGSW